MNEYRYFVGRDDDRRRPDDRLYLWLLLEHMDRMKLSICDPKLARLVLKARNAMHALSGELRYQCRSHGVGRPPMK